MYVICSDHIGKILLKSVWNTFLKQYGEENPMGESCRGRLGCEYPSNSAVPKYFPSEAQLLHFQRKRNHFLQLSNDFLPGVNNSTHPQKFEHQETL